MSQIYLLSLEDAWLFYVSPPQASRVIFVNETKMRTKMIRQSFTKTRMGIRKKSLTKTK